MTRTFCQGEALRIGLVLDSLRVDVQRTGRDFGDGSFQRVAILLEIAGTVMVDRMHSDDMSTIRRSNAPPSVKVKSSRHMVETLIAGLADTADHGVIVPIEKLRDLLDDALALRKLVNP